MRDDRRKGNAAMETHENMADVEEEDDEEQREETKSNEEIQLTKVTFMW